MKEALVDVSVLLVFFTRHEQFRQVFEQVKKARPSQLFLYQDGPRENHPEDLENIMKCREIAENIDWKCKVHCLYQEKNAGCDPSGYLAQTWAFSIIDKCIVIEDDDVPSISFFPFCKELLDKYENDERIMLITGLNIDEVTNYCPYSYFFTETSFTVGCWASWRRVVSHWDKDYCFLQNPYYSRLLNLKIEKRKFSKGFIHSCAEHLNSGKEYFETIMISNQYLDSGLTIVPQKNMVLNIGIGGDATHTAGTLRCQPKGYRKIFELNTYEIEKINHPIYVIEDYDYKERAYRVYGWGHLGVKIYRTIESLFYRLRYGDIKGGVMELKNKAKNVIKHKIS